MSVSVLVFTVTCDFSFILLAIVWCVYTHFASAGEIFRLLIASCQTREIASQPWHSSHAVLLQLYMHVQGTVGSFVIKELV